MKITRALARTGQLLPDIAIQETLQNALAGKFNRQRLLVLIPDHTRTLPLPMLFRVLVTLLEDAKQLDFMVALGTHPALSEQDLCNLLDMDQEERFTKYSQVRLLNHNWTDPDGLESIGTISQEQVIQIARDHWHPSLGGDVTVRVSKSALTYDHILILGPTFPHEVVGFSGGAKYLFPGISGPEIINITHWLGALSGVVNTIGIQDTPVRELIHAAAALFPKPVTLIAPVVDGRRLAGLFIGDIFEAWQRAAALSAKRHIRWCQKPFQRVFSCPSPMYNELWTASKAMYKLEPVIRKGGEIIIYAPYLDAVSHVHGKYIFEAGYHILPYILENWEILNHIPLAVLAHLTHLRGSGIMEQGRERPDFQVTLSSGISREDCYRLNLGYLDPASINPTDFMDREQEGLLYVPRAGETLYRIRDHASEGSRV